MPGEEDQGSKIEEMTKEYMSTVSLGGLLKSVVGGASKDDKDDRARLRRTGPRSSVSPPRYHGRWSGSHSPI
ncbi:MAG: hypothetical protein LLG16_01745 [Euryarchaeota archaeon]|nr:hypothetical protein [Euryarchaeota archaeon]